MSLVVRPPDALFLPPSIPSKWRGLRGLVELAQQLGAPRRSFLIARLPGLPLALRRLLPTPGTNFHAVKAGMESAFDLYQNVF